MDVIVNENRRIILHGIGQMIGEHNATVLNFTFPEKIIGIDIDELNKYLIFDTEGLSPQLIENNTFDLSNLYTKQNELIMQIHIKHGNDLLFKTEKFMIEFEDGIEVHYETTVDDLDVIDNLITQYQLLVANIVALQENLANFEITIENAEALRNLAENARIESEELRVDNENERIQNENTRKTNETNRQQKFSTLSTQMENAIREIDNVINTKVSQRFENMRFLINNKGELEVQELNG